MADDVNEDGMLDSNHQLFDVKLTGATTADEFFEGADELDLFFSGKALRDLLDELAEAGIL